MTENTTTTTHTRAVAIVLAGGKGSRFGGYIPKQLMPLAGQSVLAHTLEVFDIESLFEQIIVVANPSWIVEIQKEVSRSVQTVGVGIVPGSSTRNGSLRNALGKLIPKERKVLVHDAVRPLVPRALISRVIDELDHCSAVLPVVRSSDLLVMTEMNGESRFLARDRVFQGQAPQGFYSGVLKSTFDSSNDGVTLDKATIYEAVLAVHSHLHPRLIDGAQENIKITLPVDHMIAQRLLEDRNSRIPEDLV